MLAEHGDPSRRVLTVIAGLVAEAWKVVEPNIAGLTDDEYFWEPAPGCWSVRRRSELTTADSWGRGEYAVKTSFDSSHEPTTTTIAWRLLHAYDCFRDYASRAFGRGPRDWNDIEIPGSATAATRMMTETGPEPSVADLARSTRSHPRVSGASQQARWGRDVSAPGSG